MSFEGEIGELDLVQRLVELGREHFTGAIRFEQDGIIKIVYFKGGDVLSASTNDRTDAVDEILLRAGKVSKEHVKQALSKRKESESLGDALLNLGFITRKELTWGRRIQVIGILRSVRSWDHGSYAIVADYLPKREEGTLFPLQQILIELFVTEPDRQPFERALDGGMAVLTKTEGFDEAFQRLGLNDEAAEIASKIDGKTSAAEIAAATGKDVFNTYKLLEALRALALVSKKEEKPQAKDELGFESVGVADAADAWSSGRMPAFQTEPEPPVEPAMESAPPPAVAIPPPGAPEIQWGFDEAQIETASRASAPPPPAPKPSSARATQTQSRRKPPPFTRPQSEKQRHVPVFALIVLLIIAAAGFGGWWWWKGQPKVVPQPAPVVQKPRPVIKPTPAPPPPTTTTFAAVVPEPVPPPAPVPAPNVAPALSRREPAGEPVLHPKFTIQIELVCQDASLKKATAIGGANVWSIPISYRGQRCSRVFWGRYETREKAEAAATQIPAALRTSKPVVVTIPQP
jgi:septal ring-binding cell division protein DamX